MYMTLGNICLRKISAGWRLMKLVKLSYGQVSSDCSLSIPSVVIQTACSVLHNTRGELSRSLYSTVSTPATRRASKGTGLLVRGRAGKLNARRLYYVSFKASLPCHLIPSV